MATAVSADDVRARREVLGVSRLTLAVQSGVSPTWLACIEAGLRPRGEALNRVLAALDRLELQKSAEWPLQPGVGISCFRDDTDQPTEAA